MNHLRVLCYLIFIKLVYSQITDILLSEPNARSGYTIGEKVTLTCVVRLTCVTNACNKGQMSMLIQHKGIHKAENGLCNFEQYKCDIHTIGNIHHYILTMEKLVWDDRGEWSCILGKNILRRIIDIKVIGKVQTLRARLIDNKENKNKVYIPVILYGKGVRTNPYDLTTDVSIYLYCSTTCSVPASEHEWTYLNQSIGPKKLTINSGSNSSCTFNSGGEGTMVLSRVLINCLVLSMVGSNQVTCTMRGSSDSQSVFVLCPGGHNPITLTNGEIIGISIAVGISALIIVTFFMSAKRVVNSYRYGAVGQGIRL